MAADFRSPRGRKVTAGFRQQRQPGPLGSFKSCPGPVPGMGRVVLPEGGPAGLSAHGSFQGQPLRARKAQDTLQTDPHWTTRKLCSGEGGTIAHLGLFHRAGLPSPVPTLSRKRQGFSSKNTRIRGEPWGPQEPQAASALLK